MNLGQLRALLRDNILYDRSDAIAGDPDELWSDDTLNTYINESVRRFATRGFVIKDGSTAAVTEVTLVEGQTSYELHQSVIAVVSAKVSTADFDLARTGHSILNAYVPPSSNTWDMSLLTALNPGTPIAYSTDEEISEDADSTFSAVTLRVFPEPDADAAGTIIKLRVFRKPLADLAVDADIPEIPIDHHLDMLDWAAYLALRIVDTDAGNDRRADKFAASFEAHVTAARKMVLRKLFAPQGWGFGRGGWAWGS